MATELATAYVTLVPTLGGAQAKIQSELSGISLTGAGKAMGGSLSSGMTSAVRSAGDFFGSTFTRAAKVGVAAVGAIGTGVAALAARGGLTRALNLEQAQTMFKGLKLDWADYKDTVNDAVTGTAFSLDAAALVAAQLASSGVGAGEQMQKALNACVGTAATFGTELGDVGSIFQKVAAKGKLGGDELLQLNERGINALSVLSEYLGKNQEEVRKMVTEGKVDFETFSNAMFAAFGESAQAANETFTGSLSNMRSALSRMGEGFMTPFKDACIPVFNSVRQAIDQVSSALDPVKAMFAELVSVVGGKVVAVLDGFTSRMKEGCSVMDAIRFALYEAFGQENIDRIVGIVSALGGLAALGPTLKVAAAGMEVASAAAKGMSSVGSSLSSAAGSIAGFVGRLPGYADAALSFGTTFVKALVPDSAYAAVQSAMSRIDDAVISATNGIKNKVLPTLSSIKEGVSGKLSGVGSAVDAAMGGIPSKVASTLSEVGTKLSAGASLAAVQFKERFNIGSHADGEGSKLSAAFGKIRSAAGSLASPLMTAVGGITAVAGGLMMAGIAAVAAGVDIQGACNAFLGNIQNLTAQLPAFAEQLAQMLPGVIQQVTAAMPALVQAFATALTTLVDALPLILPALTEGLTAMMKSVVAVLPTLIPLLLEAGLQLFTALVQSLSDVLPTLIDQIPVIVTEVSNVLIENLPLLLEAGLTLFCALVTAFVEMLPSLIAQLPTLIDRVTSTLIGFIPTLANCAVTLFQAIVNAVPKILASLLAAVGDLLSQIPGKIVSFAGELANAAKEMVMGMVRGIQDAASWVINAIGGLCDSALGAVKSFFGIASPSKLMRRMFGFVGSGAALGITDSIPKVVSAMNSLVGRTTDAAEMLSPDLAEVELAAKARRDAYAPAQSQATASAQERRLLADAFADALSKAGKDQEITVVLNLDRREFARWERKAA